MVLTVVIIAIANFILGVGCLIGWRPIRLYLVIISVVNFVIALLALLNLNTSQLGTNINQWMALLIAAAWLGTSIYVLLTVQSRKTKAWFHAKLT